MRFLLCLLVCLLPGAVSLAAQVETVDRLLLALDRVAVGEAIKVDGALFGAVLDGPVLLERIELRAPGARVYVVRDDELVPFDYPRRKVFMGKGPGRESARIGLLFDPVGLRLGGTLVTATGMQALSLSSDKGWRIKAHSPDALLPPDVELTQSCGNLALDQSDRVPELQLGQALDAPASARQGGLRYGVLALDTDAEWLDKRFDNDEAAAAAYFEELMVATNTVFQAQLSLRMLQGDTILRVGSDPYSQKDSGASRAHLDEFGAYWASNMDHIDRTHAALISGNSSSGNSASGIAWLDTYCRTGAYGGSYSVNQLFHSAGVAVEKSAQLLAHELGHNLGSSHTHCYQPEIDQCYAAESGCYSGPVSCPAGGQGTLMSYCHVSSAGCGNNKFELHSRVESRLLQKVAANTPSCLGIMDENPPVFEDRFER